MASLCQLVKKVNAISARDRLVLTFNLDQPLRMPCLSSRSSFVRTTTFHRLEFVLSRSFSS